MASDRLATDPGVITITSGSSGPPRAYWSGLPLDYNPCQECGGTGSVWKEGGNVTLTGSYYWGVSAACPKCNGMGWVKVCPNCGEPI
ncbi:hypothetical protein LCGC14_1307410 [marine sediment metagenome]|uniref:Uncharacterized protein n=1 Tax=marine sediment metagenome TaxID=412755 RepID=A0A0F9NQT4_9ZZZZ